MMTPGINLPNLSRAQIRALLAQQAPATNADLGIYSIDSYDRNQALSRLPGDDMNSIAASATKDAAECSRSGKLHLSWSLPVWIAGAASLFFLGAPVAGVVALGLGSLGAARGVQKLARSNHDKLLMNDIQQLLSDPSVSL
jgi:hypothetical protein